MSELEIRLFGGFDARFQSEVLNGFDSQKSRALLAYLAVEDRQIERETLAGLFWPDRSSDSARRNLRQTLHSARGALREAADGLLQADHHSVWLDPEVDLWVDVRAFSAAVSGGLSEGGGVDPHQLTIAARLYAGELLAGFYLKGCSEFEEWLVTEQERLRDEAVAALRALVTAYRRRGEYRFGIQYARRLLFIDPLSEETHRELMQLYAHAGHRPRALAQYELLSNLLETELGVEPLEETTGLYRAILLDQLPSAAPDSEDAEEPIGPLIPLVGRADAFSTLEDSWREVLTGHGRMTILEGEAGSGKSRLCKSFVDRATTRRRAVVLRGRSYEAAPLIAYQPIAEMIEGAFVDLLPSDSEAAPDLSDDLFADLALAAPRLHQLGESADREMSATGTPDARRIPASFLEFLDLLISQSAQEALPIVLMLEDLQWADQASLDLIRAILPEISQRPVWIVATRRSRPVRHDPIGADADDSAPIERLEVGRLTRGDVTELAAALVDVSQAGMLADFLWDKTGGLPLAAAELINHLWDEGLLTPARPGVWHLREKPRDAVVEFDKLTDLIHRRVLRLPHSTRRLISLAAAIGHQFDADLLRRGANEHLKVIEIGIELMLESWLIRQFPRSWSSSGRQADIVLWARGVRRGWFQFAHAATRTAILKQINPIRKKVMHRSLATALREIHGDDLEEACETIAFHEMAAGEWERALPCLEAAVAKAERCGATAVAAIHRQSAVEVIDRLLQADKAGRVESLEGARRRLRGAPKS